VVHEPRTEFSLLVEEMESGGVVQKFNLFQLGPGYFAQRLAGFTETIAINPLDYQFGVCSIKYILELSLKIAHPC